MRSGRRFAFVLAAAAAALVLPAAAAPFSTGAIPIDPAVYDAFPHTPEFRAFLPERIDLSKRFPPPGDQGAQGSCVGWAVAYAARSYYADAIDGRSSKKPANIASPAYVFNSITSPGCNGSRIPDALNLLTRGALSLDDYPYDDTSCAAPPRAAAERASDFRIRSWFALDKNNLDQIKGELALGNPVVISADLFESFFFIDDGSIYEEDTGTRGYHHAMVVVGYDEKDQAFTLLNSWGTAWGQEGHALVGYDTFRSMVDAAYVMRFDTAPPVPDDPAPPPLPVPRPEPEPGPAPAPPPAPAPDLPAVSCGTIAVSADGTRLEGFVGEPAELEAAEQYAKAHALEAAVALRPWPQCELLVTLQAQLATPDRPAIDPDSDGPLAAGRYFSFDVTTPERTSFLHVAYVQADGSVVNLMQSDIAALRQFHGHERVGFGDVDDAGPRFRVGPPFGNEMMLVIASDSPLFGAPRPRLETEREFLTAIRKAVAARQHTGTGGAISAAVEMITTVEGDK